MRDSAELDTNSFYCYHLICTTFGRTCRVAELAGDVVGFLTAFQPPEDLETLFVWQLYVSDTVRGQGVATSMIEHLLRSQSKPVRFLEATVAPQNTASLRTFEALARRSDSPLALSSYLAAGDFPVDGGEHPDELLVRIGPLS